MTSYPQAALLMALFVSASSQCTYASSSTNRATTERCKTVAELLSAPSSETPPLPPRDPAARPALHDVPVDAEPTKTVIQVVVQGQPTPVQSVPDHGWRAGRVRIDELSGETPQAGSSTETQPSDAATLEQRTAASTTVVVSDTLDDSRTVLVSGVFPSEVVFDGVAVLANPLAPCPTGLFEEGQSVLAGLTFALAPQPLETGAGPNELAPTPVDVATQAPSDGDAESPKPLPTAVTPLDHLHKPLASVTLTTGLHDREPPDLAAEALRTGPPCTIWGEPWPTTNHAAYRYSVPFHHRPLYFEQPNFERCGVSCGVFSPYVSAANFAGNVVLLPLHMLLDPPCTCVPTLGDCHSCQRFGLCPHGNLNGY